MTIFLKAKNKKSKDKTNIDKYKSCKYYRISNYIKFNLPRNHYSKIHDDKAMLIISFRKMYVKMSKINIFKKDVRTI